MSVPPESIKIGRCYLMSTGHIRRIVQVMPDGRVVYEARPGHVPSTRAWRSGILDPRSFLRGIEREVPCDWTPDADEV